MKPSYEIPTNEFPTLELTLTAGNARLLSDSKLLLIPELARAIGGKAGIIDALVLQQLHYRLRYKRIAFKEKHHDAEYTPELVSVDFSAKEWVDEFRFLSRSTIMRSLRRLKRHGWMLGNAGTAYSHGGRKGWKRRTTFWSMPDHFHHFDSTEQVPARFFPGQSIALSPSLAKSLGLNAALLLQQVHINVRRKGVQIEGEKWIVKTFDQWQLDDLSCMSVRSIKSAMKLLEKANLVISRNDVVADIRIKAYRVNYKQLHDNLPIYEKGASPDQSGSTECAIGGTEVVHE